MVSRRQTSLRRNCIFLSHTSFNFLLETHCIQLLLINYVIYCFFSANSSAIITISKLPKLPEYVTTLFYHWFHNISSFLYVKTTVWNPLHYGFCLLFIYRLQPSFCIYVSSILLFFISFIFPTGVISFCIFFDYFACVSFSLLSNHLSLSIYAILSFFLHLHSFLCVRSIISIHFYLQELHHFLYVILYLDNTALHSNINTLNNIRNNTISCNSPRWTIQLFIHINDNFFIFYFLFLWSNINSFSSFLLIV